MARIADPVFNGAATDKLESVDVYKTTSPEVRNAYSNVVGVFGQSLEETLGVQNRQLDSIGDSYSRGQVKPEDVRKSVIDVLSGSRGSFSKLSKDIQGNLLENALEELTGQPVQIRTPHGNKNVPARDLDNAVAISDYLKDLTGSGLFEAVNLGAEAALIGSALEKVSEWGIPELIDDILDKIKDEKVRRRVVERSARNIVNVADIDTIERFINNVGASALVAKHPDIGRQLLQRYQFRGEVTPVDYPRLRDQLIRVMNQIQPNWLRTRRGDEDVWNLAFINIASDAVRLLFISEPQYRTPFLIAPHYPPVHATRLIRNMYPMIAM